jgi:AraC-like DNA-binding protein
MPSNVTNSIPIKLQLHEWASLRSELIWIYDREVRPLYLSGRTPSERGYRLWLIRPGTVSIKTEQQTIVAGAGRWVIPGEDYCEQIFSPEARILSIHFLCQWPSGENLITLSNTLVAKNETHPKLENVAKKLDRLLRREFPEESRREQHYNRQLSDYEVFNRFQSLFLDWLHVWFRFLLKNGGQLTRMTSGDSRPFQAARVLNLASLEQSFPDARLQRETGLGLVRLNQLFFREFKLTLRKFWDRRRLDFAKQCLETSRMSIKEISYRLNFRSNSHFVIWFRRLAGSRPSDYRQKYLCGIKP